MVHIHTCMEGTPTHKMKICKSYNIQKKNKEQGCLLSKEKINGDRKCST